MLIEEVKLVATMAFCRLLTGTIEVCAALLMLRHKQVETAVHINAVLGLIGPLMFVVVSALGLLGLAGKLPLSKLVLVVAGVALILIAARK